MALKEPLKFFERNIPEFQKMSLQFAAFGSGEDLKRELVAALIERAGPVELLVNNAGLQHVSPLEQFPEDEWDRLLAVMLTAPFLLSKGFLPRMYEAGWGRVINVSSVHGLVASPFKSAYVAAKHGIVGFTKAAALETATTGVTVNAICPGWVLTPLVQKQIDDRAARESISADKAKVELLSEKQPSLQFVTPQQLGDLAVFLCSPAADNVRGAAWNVDGGWTAQ